MKKWIFCLLLMVAGSKIWAQGCSLCALDAKSLGSGAGVGLNNGILYLAAIPILFLTTVGVIWFYRNRPDKEE